MEKALMVEPMNKNSAAYKHFAPKIGKHGMAAARCGVIKFTECRTKSGITECKIQKNVRCASICKVKSFNLDGSINVDDCDKSLCKMPFSAEACREVASTA